MKTPAQKGRCEKTMNCLHSVDLHKLLWIMKDSFEKNKEDEKLKNFKAKALP
jgi:hypothetical protein